MVKDINQISGTHQIDRTPTHLRTCGAEVQALKEMKNAETQSELRTF